VKTGIIDWLQLHSYYVTVLYDHIGVSQKVIERSQISMPYASRALADEGRLNSRNIVLLRG